MIILTTEQKLTAYKFCLENLRNKVGGGSWICNKLIKHMFDIELTTFYIPRVLQLYPELAKQMPTDYDHEKGGAAWADDQIGILYRELALTNAIKELEIDDLLS